MLEVFIFSENSVAPVRESDPFFDGVRVVGLSDGSDSVDSFGLLGVLREGASYVP